VPEWVLKFIQRLLALRPGRYQIILTIGKDNQDWTVTELGKVERP
jgi:hypothetical protein